MPFLEFISQCKNNVNKEANIIKVAEDFLIENNVAPWTEIPLWIPKTKEEVSIKKALKEQLTFTPLKKTIKATLNWNNNSRPEGFQYYSGMKPTREQEILRLWLAK